MTKHDIFFISYDETNAEKNWQRLLSLHPNAKRIHKFGSISESHLLCNKLCTTDRFWTIDGDNWLLCELFDSELDYDLLFYQAIDGVDGNVDSGGAIKSWKKNSMIDVGMSKGDFCKNATTNYFLIHKVLSEHRYNCTPYETWRHTFRHMTKCFSGIITHKSLQINIDRVQKHKQLNVWSYRGYLDAKNYVEVCGNDFTKINKINDYDWLKTHFSTCTNQV